MERSPSDKLGAVADVAAAIEAAGNEITDLQVTVDDETARGTAHVDLPVVEAPMDPTYRFDLASATLVDGSLRIELDVAATSGDRTAGDGTPHADAAPADESDPSTRADAADESAVTGESDATESASDGSSDGASTSSETATKEATESGDGSAATEEDRPAYRDPERLAAVYDPAATFKQMTEELGVDVTPNTVRKYMVEHGIHEPQERVSDVLEGASDETGERATEDPAGDETDERATEDPAGDGEDSTGAPTDTATRTEEGAAVPRDGNANQEGTSRTPTADRDDDTAAARSGEGSASDAVRTGTRATDGGNEPPLSAIDPLELPGGVSTAEFVDVLTSSRTVYEVQRGLGLDSTEVRSLLRRYDLIDLVTGRLTHGADPPSEQEVLSRLIEATDRAS